MTLDSGFRPPLWRIAARKSSGNVGADRKASWFHAPTSLVVEGAAVRRRSFLGGRDYIDGSFCTEKPDPGDIDDYWVEPDESVYDRIDPYWIDFELVLVPHVKKWKWRMWVDYGVEFFIHPAMKASPEMGFPEFFRQDRDGQPRGVIKVMKAVRS